MCDCEIFLLVDSCGDYAVGNSIEAAREKYEEGIQALTDAEGFRIVKLLVKVPLPEVVEMTGEVPAQGAAVLSVA